ncbi:MAG: hypothetical protein KAR20_20970, partial [Candidatus Heimdallarchaeota archaeon]|nr:hypothetical protein [Candidatus Heimdallarchaeota archaeon]
QSIPQAGKIYFIKNCNIEPKDRVISEWRRTFFLRESKGTESRGWTLAVMKCIDRLAKIEFFLEDIYLFEEELKHLYPNNKHIKDKIRQQLQILRDKEYLEFVGRGRYRVLIFERDRLVDGETRKLQHKEYLPSEGEQFIDNIEIEINEKLKFVEYLPVYDLQAVATSFKEQTTPVVIGWRRMRGKRKLNKDMFIAKVIGKSMEPTIPDGAYCLFRLERGGSRNGLVVLIESRRVMDPETRLAFTIKRYYSEKEDLGEGQWRHKRIVLSPDNKNFENIVLEETAEEDFHIVAEFVSII